jgi:hypothetical protein
LPKINWTIVIILIISCFTFVTGYLLNFYTDKAENLRSNVDDFEKEFSSMESQRDIFINFDVDHSNLAQLLFAEASKDTIEYRFMNSSFATARESKLNTIKSNLELMFWNLNNTYTAQIQSVFEFKNMDWISFATKAKNGYNYVITRENWEQNNPGFFVTAEEFLVEAGFNSSVISDLFNYFGTEFSKTALVLVIDWNNLYLLHDKVIFKQITTINDKKAELSNTQAITTLLSVSVSIATIGTVLSTAMTSKSFEKKIDESFKILHKEILKAEGIEPFPKTKRSKIAIVGLMIAFFFAFFGLISALLNLI